jgi:ATP-dependent exoDNAse (exonuclease V) alpha subunit
MTQAEALDLLKMGHNAFITGPAGSGKTFVLNQYIKYLKDREIEIGVTASTGIAASHMGGMTIHSWSGLGIRDYLSDYDLEDLEQKSYLRQRLSKAKVLIIDEISMMHHFRLDLVDRILRQLRRSNDPFGGLQVILCGDFFQLPPVSRGAARGRGELADPDLFSIDDTAPQTEFAYHSPAWKNLDLKICYLEEQHRQEDPLFLNVLNAIRSGTVPANVRASLDARYRQPAVGIEPTKLYTHNVNVDAENELELDKISGQLFEYDMIGRGRAALVETIKKGCLSPEILRLKKGARVMFVKNNFELGFVNGTLGVVEHLNEYGVTVRTAAGKLIDVPLASWVIEEDGKIKAEITQYPLRLAWAITVHKSQGMSLDAALIDLSRAFEPGMGYVALSRVRSLAGLTLLGLNETALKVNDEVLEYDQHFSQLSEKHAEELRRLKPQAVKEKQSGWLQAIAPAVTGSRGKKAKPKLSTVEETKQLLEAGKSLAEIVNSRRLTPGTILGHCEEIKDNYPGFDFRPFLKNCGLSQARQLKIRLALTRGGMIAGHYQLLPAKEILGNSTSFDEIRLVRLAI